MCCNCMMFGSHIFFDIPTAISQVIVHAHQPSEGHKMWPLRQGAKKSRKMSDKIYNYQIFELGPIDEGQVARLARCWNILRTLSNKELESLEKQTDLVIEEHGEEFVAVHIGPSLPF